VTIVPTLEAVNPAARSRAGFRFTTGTWRGDIYQMDPRTITRVRWQGNDRTVVRPGDQIFFSILNEAEDFLLFPPTVPQNPVFLATPTAQEYTIPPFFFDIGQAGVMQIQYQRTLFTSGISADRSTRLFRAKVEMVDSYSGYALTALPAGTAKREYSPKADFDRDGMTNIQEFAYQFPTNEDISARAREQFVPLPTDGAPPGFVSAFNKVRQVSKVVNPIVDFSDQPDGPDAAFLDAENHVVFEAPYRPRTGNTLRYTFGQKIDGKKKPVPLKIGTDWVQEIVDGTPQTLNVFLEVKIVEPASGATVLLLNRAAATPVVVTPQIIRIRSVAAVDPLAPLPEIVVNLTPVTLK
jgi:hypothetical protein